MVISNFIKEIPVNIMLHTYKITFSYETWKGHERKTDVRKITHLSLDDAKRKFKEWSHKTRTMSNVQILDIEEINSKRKKFLD